MSQHSDRPTASPSSVLGHTPTTSSGTNPVRRPFRRSLLDRQDPFEDSGVQMVHFSPSGSHRLKGIGADIVVHEILELLSQNVAESHLSPVEVQSIEYDDVSVSEEPARRFFALDHATIRKTNAKINVYFSARGYTLYYSVRSYLVPPMSISRFVATGIATFLTTVYLLEFCAFIVIAMGAERSTTLGFFLAVLPLPALLIYRKVIRNLLAGDSPLLALRKQFPGPNMLMSFDEDDVDLFFKSNLSTILTTVATVLERHGVDTARLKQTVQHISTINIDNRGGIFEAIDAIIGGASNSISRK